jgi:hypothetical protein
MGHRGRRRADAPAITPCWNAVPFWRQRLANSVCGRQATFAQDDSAGLIENANRQNSGVQIDAAVELLLFGLKHHELGGLDPAHNWDETSFAVCLNPPIPIWDRFPDGKRLAEAVRASLRLMDLGAPHRISDAVGQLSCGPWSQRFCAPRVWVHGRFQERVRCPLPTAFRREPGRATPARQLVEYRKP